MGLSISSPDSGISNEIGTSGPSCCFAVGFERTAAEILVVPRSVHISTRQEAGSLGDPLRIERWPAAGLRFFVCVPYVCG
eukprot:s3938_g9.t1